MYFTAGSLKSLLSNVSATLEPGLYKVQYCHAWLVRTLHFVDYITFVQQMHIIFVNTKNKCTIYFFASILCIRWNNKIKKTLSCSLLVNHFIGPL